MKPPGDLPRRIAIQYDLPLQVASFFALLILSETVTPESISTLGDVNIYGMVYRLRCALKETDIEIKSRRTIGYWLDDDVRRGLAGRFNIELGIGI